MSKVFVYGTLKAGHGNHHLLANARLIGKGLSCSRYRMFCNGSFPMIVKSKSEGYQIAGELYEVDQTTLDRLDILEGVVSKMYLRDTTAVAMEDGKQERGFVYVWNRSGEWILKNTYPEIETGDWRPSEEGELPDEAHR